MFHINFDIANLLVNLLNSGTLLKLPNQELVKSRMLHHNDFETVNLNSLLFYNLNPSESNNWHFKNT